MSIAKMSLVNIIGGMDSLDAVMMHLTERDDFHPEQASYETHKAGGFVSLSGDNPYTEVLARATDIGIGTGYGIDKLPCDHTTKPFGSLEEVQRYIEDLFDTLEQLQEKERNLKETIVQHENALIQLDHIEGLDASFDELFSSKFLKVRFGRLPVDSIPKLKYYQDHLFIICSFKADEHYHWCVYFTVEEFAPEIDDIFSSLFFERMRVPEDVHGTPERARESINESLAREKQQLSLVSAQKKQYLEENRQKFCEIYARLKFLHETYELRRYVYVLNNIFYVLGFVPQDESDAFVAEFEKIQDVKVTTRPPDSDKRLVVPTKLKNNRLVKPFEQFVLMYGTPSYTDIDPTPFVALTYMLLFGIMFGDLGQGLVIMLAGIVMWRWKKMSFGKILTRIGASSAIFGCIYGSVFGFEHALDGIYQTVFGLPEKPIEVMAPDTTNLILGAAVGIGAVIIIVSILINIITGIRQRDWDRALFSQNGVAGLAFYGYVLIAACGTLFLGINLFHPILVVLLIVLPLLVMFFKEPIGKLFRGLKAGFEGGVGSFITESFFELFEIVLSFVTNTMSFLRVGGFVLSHAGMMAVVFTLSQMVGGGASPVVIVFGNIFVMAMEGLIVGIQVLRLEFYEIFSRFYEGDGKPFTPVNSQFAE